MDIESVNIDFSQFSIKNVNWYEMTIEEESKEIMASSKPAQVEEEVEIPKKRRGKNKKKSRRNNKGEIRRQNSPSQ